MRIFAFLLLLGSASQSYAFASKYSYSCIGFFEEYGISKVIDFKSTSDRTALVVSVDIFPNDPKYPSAVTKNFQVVSEDDSDQRKVFLVATLDRQVDEGFLINYKINVDDRFEGQGLAHLVVNGSYTDKTTQEIHYIKNFTVRLDCTLL